MEWQLENMPYILVTLEVSHFDKSGKDIIETHMQKIASILITLVVSHFDISGKDVNAQQL